jgi:hypothetical protein
MSKYALSAKYETLSAAAQKQVQTFVEFLSKTSSSKPARLPSDGSNLIGQAVWRI